MFVVGILFLVGGSLGAVINFSHKASRQWVAWGILFSIFALLGAWMMFLDCLAQPINVISKMVVTDTLPPPLEVTFDRPVTVIVSRSIYPWWKVTDDPIYSYHVVLRR